MSNLSRNQIPKSIIGDGNDQNVIYGRISFSEIISLSHLIEEFTSRIF
jgi:hypothetical protein